MHDRTEYFSNYYQRNKEVQRERRNGASRKYYQRHAKRIKAKNKLYTELHKEIRRQYWQRRYAEGKIRLACLREMWKDYFGQPRQTTAYPSMVGRSMAM